MRDLDPIFLEKRITELEKGGQPSPVEEHVYSTTEQKVGKWLDGSDIFEKTMSFTLTENTGDVEKDYVVDSSVSYKRILFINYVDNTNVNIPRADKPDEVLARHLLTNNHLTMRVKTGYDRSTLVVTMVVQYLKN